MKIKNNTKLQTYSTFSENVVRIGDTLILGAPTSSETSSRTVGGSYGDRGRVGAAKTRSTTTKLMSSFKWVDLQDLEVLWLQWAEKLQ